MLCGCRKVDQQQPRISGEVGKFTEVYVAYLQRIAADTQVSERQKHLDTVLAEHKMSAEQFYATYDYLKSHPDKMSAALTNIQSGLQELERPGTARVNPPASEDPR